ncbi:hypothetical protein ABPG75_014062 [Micractinium tetrahymenae]
MAAPRRAATAAPPAVPPAAVPPAVAPAARWLLPLLLLLVPCATAAPKRAPSWDDWGRRAVYQVVTDRFATPGTQTAVAEQTTCPSLSDYCGGGWRGILRRLDYIQGLNLNALWTSPISANSFGGYHGYWPTNFFSTNPYFGSEEDLRTTLQELSDQGIYNILDVVINHVGYGSDVHTPAYQPFSDPDLFNSCDGCGAYCDIPDNATLEQRWDCELSGLPDLNQSHPYVRQQLASWVKTMQGQLSIHLLRLDAAGNVHPDFFPWLDEQTPFQMWLEIFSDQLELLDEYEAVRGGANYSYLSFPLYYATLDCFANVAPIDDIPGVQCEKLSTARKALHHMGADTRRLGFFVENHDTDRFLSLRDDLPAYRNALAHALLSEGIPVIYYGAEQGMRGLNVDSTNREPLWQTGYSVSHPLYTFIRTLGWYRGWMDLWAEPFEEHYFDTATYVFSRGSKMLVVLTSGVYNSSNLRPDAYQLTELHQFAGTTLCDALHSWYCVQVGPSGAVAVEASPTNEPLVLVPSKWMRLPEFFVPLAARPVLWQQGLAVTLVTPAVAALVWLAGLYALHCWYAKRFQPLADLAAAWRANAPRCACLYSARAAAEGKPAPVSLPSPLAGGTVDTSVKSGRTGSEWVACAGNGNTSSYGGGSGDEFEADQSDWGVDLEEGALPTRWPSVGVMEYLGSVKARRCLLQSLVDSLKADPGMVMHVCLEYAVPHLGLVSELQYGGLGKVVETFIAHTTRPMMVCAPMYRPFYGEDGRVVHFASTSPIMTVPVLVGGTQRKLVDVYITSTPASVDVPPIFFLLLASEVFCHRTRGTIYQHASEEEELTFFSVFNQAVAHVAEALGVTSMQFHDYHGALSLMYLPPRLQVRALLVAHNADYNGTWHLGSAEREAWIYSMLNIPLTRHSRSLCEHAGRFNMLRPLLEHMRLWQQGLGVVAVSPRYATRCYDKFSFMWKLPPGAVCGVLNGLPGSEGHATEGVNVGDLFARKASAKLALQLAKGLQVGEQHRLLVFLGRITHQKGCDLIALAARDILIACPTAQIVMAGPVGDETGEKARVLLDKVVDEFPGRVWNAAGQYVAGEEKERLCLATDFFLCPSRFEPCGLADIEFGWLGAVQIGHNTGGLGKMPGYYYTAELDCVQDQALRLADAALRALAAPPAEVRALAEQALRAQFPPRRMVAAYDRVWRRLRGMRFKVAPVDVPQMAPAEAHFYADQWLEDNTPYDPKAAEERQAQRAHRELRTWAGNLLLLLMQASRRALPSVLSLLWLSDCLKAGSIQYVTAPTVASIAASPTATYFYCYAGSALAFQALGLLLPPLRYIQLAACVNVAAVLLVLWSLWAPQAAEVLYLINASTAATWGPMAAFIFLDLPKASVSEHGPAVMGYADALQRAMSVAAVTAIMRSQGSADISGFRAGGIALLVVAIWFAIWLLRPNGLSPHFRHYRLRPRGALTLLLRLRRAWMAATAVTTLDSFALGFLLSTIYKLQYELTQWYMLAFALTCLAASAALAVLLISRLGRRLGLRLMYGLAALPGVVLLQAVLVMYGGVPGLYIAATVVGALNIRTNMVGLLTLHTLPTRETFTLIKTLQVVLGSLSIVLGLAFGGAGGSPAEIWAVVAVYEGLRLALAAVLLRTHRRENIAKP